MGDFDFNLSADGEDAIRDLQGRCIAYEMAIMDIANILHGLHPDLMNTVRNQACLDYQAACGKRDEEMQEWDVARLRRVLALRLYLVESATERRRLRREAERPIHGADEH